MIDRLGQLLSENESLFGVICRDATATDIELMAQEGYHIVWLDLEHGPQTNEEAIRLGRLITHLGMVPLVRIVELSRTHVQGLLDGGIQVLTLPDVRSGEQAAEFARLGKYPPLGERGVSSTSAGTNFTLGDDTQRTLQEANEATHLMVMFEGDEAFENLDAILGIPEIDMVTVGPMDWSIGKGMYGPEGVASLTPKFDRVLSAANEAGKITSIGAAGKARIDEYRRMGVRVFFVGPDIGLKRKALTEALAPLKATLAAG